MSEEKESKEVSPVYKKTGETTGRKKAEDIINAFVKHTSNGTFSPFKGVCKTAAAACEVSIGSSGTVPAIVESVMTGKIESGFSLISFGFSMICVLSYIVKLVFANTDYKKANLDAVQAMEDFVLIIENMEEEEIQRLLNSLTEGATQESVQDAIKEIFKKIPFLVPIIGSDTLRDELAEKIYSLLGLGNPTTRIELKRIIENFWVKQKWSDAKEKVRQDQKKAEKALKDKFLQAHYLLVASGSSSPDAPCELSVQEIKDRRRKKLAAFLMEKGSVWQGICGESKLKQILEASDVCVFVGEFIKFYEERMEKSNNFLLWLQAIFTEKEYVDINRMLEGTPLPEADVLEFFEKLPAGRRDIVMLQLRALMSGVEGFSLDVVTLEQQVEKIKEMLRSDKYSETELRKLLCQKKSASQEEGMDCNSLPRFNDWREKYCSEIEQEEKDKGVRLREFFTSIKGVEVEVLWPDGLGEHKKKFFDIFDEEDECKRKIKLRKFFIKHCWDKLRDEQKAAFSKVFGDLSYYLASMKERKATKGMYNFRWFNLAAYGSSGLGYLLRFLQFGGLLTTVGVVGLSCSIACVIFTAAGVIINAGTSFQGFYQEWHRCNNRIWLDYPWYKKHWEGVKLFFKFGTFGELTGGAAAFCTGLLFTILTMGSVIGAPIFLPIFAVGLTCTTAYFISYMCINSPRDYKYTAFASSNILTVCGFGTILTAVLALTGVISIAAISATGIGAVVLFSTILAFGLLTLGAGLFGLYKTPNSWFNKLCSKAKSVFSFKSKREIVQMEPASTLEQDASIIAPSPVNRDDAQFSANSTRNESRSSTPLSDDIAAEEDASRDAGLSQLGILKVMQQVPGQAESPYPSGDKGVSSRGCSTPPNTPRSDSRSESPVLPTSSATPVFEAVLKGLEKMSATDCSTAICPIDSVRAKSTGNFCEHQLSITSVVSLPPPVLV